MFFLFHAYDFFKRKHEIENGENLAGTRGGIKSFE